jgi:hypothetical protein
MNDSFSLSPEEELESRTNQYVIQPEHPCANCDHAFRLHADKYGCEYERGDVWVTGNQPSRPTVLMAQGPCGCKEFVPVEASDLREEEE